MCANQSIDLDGYVKKSGQKSFFHGEIAWRSCENRKFEKKTKNLQNSWLKCVLTPSEMHAFRELFLRCTQFNSCIQVFYLFLYKKIKRRNSSTFLFFKVRNSDFQENCCLILIRSFPGYLCPDSSLEGVPTSTSDLQLKKTKSCQKCRVGCHFGST